ncbi:alpha/beta hydrolase [Paenibacillus sp. SYP-B4298]|uniref:alpha/beta hydrolase n=1 Tax=Paenibacillus sp. SYP-B4298 TaxID=2996034 RepID=UPI0022DD6F60|nr:alpha/beta hydrolase [Paenibacillus sp. SYP-B4298]
MKTWFQFKWWKLLLAALLILGVAAAMYLRPYAPDQAAQTAMNGTASVQVATSGDWIQFEPLRPLSDHPDIILYPGALVKPESYAPLALRLAEAGYRTYIAKMPLNLAILGEGRANERIPSEPQRSYVIGGHSLGGVMASRFAAAHPQQLAGVFYLASYPDAKGSLAATAIPVLSITAANDGLLNHEAYETSKQYLPATALYERIEGGNHGQFGSYGVQKGDLPATISPEQQLEETAAKLIAWLDNLGQL